MEEDAIDTYWAEGYTLPALPDFRNWKLQVFSIKSISDARINIEKLPQFLRTMVNEYHAVYGVGTVKDIATFNVRCSNHPDRSMARCRQCRARREAAKLHAMKQQGVEITRGLLVRRQWIIPSQAETKVRAIEELQREDPIIRITSGPNAPIMGRKSRWFHFQTLDRQRAQEEITASEGSVETDLTKTV